MGFEIKNEILSDYTEEDGITEVSIPDGIKIIKERAFAECENIKKVIIPDSVTNIGEWAFHGCKSLETASVPEHLKEKINEVFSKNTKIIYRYKNFKTKDSVLIKYIPNGDVTTVTIPDHIKIIGEYAFKDCTNLTGITIPKGVTSIKSLTNVNIPNSVTSIGDNAFSWCKRLTSITIPDSVKNIEETAFYLCDNLKTASVPKHLKRKLKNIFPKHTKITYR